MKNIDSSLMKKFLKLAGNRLSGNWVFLGGTVLALKEAAYRVTNDIDLAGPKEATQEQTLILMKIAQELGLPVEAINQAGAFFLYRVEGWEKNLVKLHSGRRATFFIPNTTLFLLLKIQRLTETDLLDCLKMLESDGPESLDFSRLQKEIKILQKREKNPGKQTRLRKLEATISEYKDWSDKPPR